MLDAPSDMTIPTPIGSIGSVLIGSTTYIVAGGRPVYTAEALDATVRLGLRKTEGSDQIRQGWWLSIIDAEDNVFGLAGSKKRCRQGQ